jgi:nicotinamidase-related amidase
MNDFLNYLERWQADLPTVSLNALIAEAGGPERVALFCVDVTNGFCHFGPLSSERVRGIIAPIARLFRLAEAAGISHFLLPQDAHAPNAAEFAHYPPHCIRGTEEAQIVPELAELPFADRFLVFPKNSVHAAHGTDLDAWLAAHPEVTHRIVVGDCTDICAYHLAMHLHTTALANNQAYPVIVPADCVDTYDIPVETARQAGILPHPAETFHPVFLYSMALNGVRVVKTITA